MATQAPGFIDDFTKVAECPVCLSLKTDNRVLIPCGHSLCKDCLDIIVKKAKICPECKQTFTVPPKGEFTKDFRKNQVVELINAIGQAQTSPQKTQGKQALEIASPNTLCHECEKNPASIWCEDCKLSYCAQDDEPAHKPRIMQSHKRVPIVQRKETPPSSMCPEHPKEPHIAMCQKCNKLICSTCWRNSHPNHNVIPIDASQKSLLTQKWAKTVPPIIKNLTEKLNDSTVLSASLQSHFSDLEVKIDKTFQDLIEDLIQKHNKAKLELLAKKKEQTESLTHFQGLWKQELETLISQDKLISSLSYTPMSTDQWSKIEAAFQKTLTRIETDVEEHNVEFWNLANIDLENPIVSAWKSFTEQSMVSWDCNHSLQLCLFKPNFTKPKSKSVFKWMTTGYNTSGQLGLKNKNSPIVTWTQLSSPIPFLSISSGYSHSIAYGENGSVWSWGLNVNGELGLGDFNERLQPTKVSLQVGVTEVSAGYRHSAIMTKQKGLLMCGRNANGQLGLGNTTNSNTFQKVNIENVISVTHGEAHVLCLTENGNLYSWGRNMEGQLGIGNTTNQSSPRPIPTILKPFSIHASQSSSYVVTQEGVLYSWGHNYYGELGIGNYIHQSSPMEVSLMAAVHTFSVGYYHALCLCKNNKVYAWGNNAMGQLGRGSSVNEFSPQEIPFFAEVEHIKAVGQSSYFISKAKELWGCGYNSNGELGNGNTVHLFTPSKLNLSPVIGAQIAAQSLSTFFAVGK